MAGEVVRTWEGALGDPNATADLEGFAAGNRGRIAALNKLAGDTADLDEAFEPLFTTLSEETVRAAGALTEEAAA